MPPDPRDLICVAYPTFRSELDCVKSIDIFGNSSIHSKIFSLRSLDWSMRRKIVPFELAFIPVGYLGISWPRLSDVWVRKGKVFKSFSSSNYSLKREDRSRGDLLSQGMFLRCSQENAMPN